MLRLADFLGHWHLTRTIADALGPGGELIGTAQFSSISGGLDYAEDGWLRMGSLPAVKASRRYIWRADGAAIDVSFHDGRAFHRFDPVAGQPEARHECVPDLYHVTYDFGSWPYWVAKWRVVGPRKDYRMVSRYSMACDRAA